MTKANPAMTKANPLLAPQIQYFTVNGRGEFQSTDISCNVSPLDAVRLSEWLAAHCPGTLNIPDSGMSLKFWRVSS